MTADRRPPTDDDRCGTNAGYQAHHKRGEHACDLCTEAATEAQRRHRARPEFYAEEKRRTRARGRALWALARRHEREFKRLYREELRRT